MEKIEKKTQTIKTEAKNANIKQVDKENTNSSNNVQKNSTKISQDTIIYTPIKDVKKQRILSENKIETDKIQKDNVKNNNVKKNNTTNNNITKNNTISNNITDNTTSKNITSQNATQTHTTSQNRTNQILKINNENKKEEDNQFQKQPLIIEKEDKKKILKILMIIIILALFFTIVSTAFAVIYMNNKKVIFGVTVNNINISNYSKQDAVNYLQNELNNNKNYVTVKSDNYEKNIYLSDINGKFNVEQVVNDAYNIGRDNKLIINNYNILATMLLKNNITCNLEYDEELLQKKIEEISIEIPGMALDCTYVIKDNKLIIKNGTSGLRINEELFKQELSKAFSGTTKSFDLPLEQSNKKEINIDEIYKQVYKKPVNARYTTNPYKIYKEENGIDFAISIEDAKRLLLENKEEYEIPLKEIKANITVADLDDKAFPDELSTFTTYYSAGDVNRNANIALVAKSINSVVVMPGETFSYNDLIGECSTRTGYKVSTIYLNGKLSTGVGGGICQVSTTLYNTVLRANLEIVERRNHSLSVTYVPLGQDAMVSIGTQDFQFKNNRDYPIKVVATTNRNSITCKIYGLKQDVEYEVKLYSKILSKTETRTKVETYKLLYLNGKEVSRTWLSTDSYKNH